MRKVAPTLLWVSPVIPNETLDAATWVETTAYLKELGWDVTLLGEGASGVHRVDDVDMLCFPRPQIFFLGRFLLNLATINYILRRWREFDIILFHQTSGLWLLPLKLVRIVRRQQSPRFVMDTRDLDDYGTRSLKTRFRVRMSHFIFGMARILADGQTAITLRMTQLAGIREEQLLGLWPSGVKLAAFAPAQTKRSWPAPGQSLVLIYVGMLLEKRHLLPLCRALVLANEEGAAFKLRIYGDGPFRDTLLDFASQSNGAIELLAPVPHDQVPELLAGAHIGVTSLPLKKDVKYAASSPIKLFEYLAAGMPILSTRNVCHTDVVGDGEYAFWADEPFDEDLLDALRQAWTNHTRMGTLGEMAGRAAHNWTWDAAATKLSNALERELEERQHPQPQ